MSRSDEHDCDDARRSVAQSEVGCALCGETGLPVIGHADTCRGAA